MTKAELLATPKGTICRFGSNPTPWEYFGHNEARGVFYFTKPHGEFKKPVAVPDTQCANIHTEAA